MNSTHVPLVVPILAAMLALAPVHSSAQSPGFHASSIGGNGVLTVDSHDTYYDSSDGTRFVAVPIPAGATALQFRVTGGVVTDGSNQLGSPDGLYSNGQTPYNFTGTRFAGTYNGVPVGGSTGIDPALMGVFFNPSFAGPAPDSDNYRSDSGIAPDPRTQASYSPGQNQPFWIGDGLDQNNPFSSAADSYLPPGNFQTFNIPPGATMLLLGIGADIALADNQNPGGATTAYYVHVFDNSSNGPVTTVLYRGAKGGAGDPVPGEAGSTFYKFGIPSINNSGAVAFTANLVTATGNKAAVVMPDVVVAHKGDAAPGVSGAVFSSFKDVLLNNNGQVAFLAALSGSGITPANKIALFGTSAADHSVLLELAQTGFSVPEAGGATLKTITSVALSDLPSPIFAAKAPGGIFMPGTSSVFFTGKLLIGSGSTPVTKDDDVGLWVVDETHPPYLLLRKGQARNLGAAGVHTIKTFKTLAVRSGSAGQGRGAEMGPGGAPTLAVPVGGGTGTRVQVLVVTTDGLIAEGYIDNFGNTSFRAKGETAPDTGGALWKKFGLPTQNTFGAAAFLGTLQSHTGNATSANNKAIFAEDFSFSLAPIAIKGDPAPGGGTFSAFKDPVNGYNNNCAFLAKVAGGPNKNYGLFFDHNGTTSLVARVGDQPPGVPVGGQFGSFRSYALPGGFESAPLFVAKLTAGLGGVDATNTTGLWARAADGTLYLIVRTGDPLEGKTIKTLTALGAVSRSPAQTRAFNSGYDFIYRVLFTDATSAIVKTTMPASL